MGCRNYLPGRGYARLYRMGRALVSVLFSFLFGPIEALAILNIGVLVLTAHLFPAAARKTDWQIMTPMLVATVICAPIGSWFLFSRPRNNPTDHWAHHYQFIGSNSVGMALPGTAGSAPLLPPVQSQA